jgi:hypothetical protein
MPVAVALAVQPGACVLQRSHTQILQKKEEEERQRLQEKEERAREKARLKEVRYRDI